MIDFRTFAPPAQRIERLSFIKPDKLDLPGSNVLYLSPNRNNGVVKIQFWTPLGTLEQKKRFQAKSSSSLSLNGTVQHSADQIQEQFDFWGSTVSVDSHIFGTDISIKATAEFAIPTLHWLFSHVMGAIYPETELLVFKQTETAALQRKMTTPKYWSNKLCMESVFGAKSPMTSYAGLEDIQQIERDDLLDYHSRVLASPAGTWLVAGESSRELIEAISNIAASMTSNNPAISQNQKSYEPSQVKKTLHPMENSTQVSMVMARELPQIAQEEFHKFALLNMLLGGYFGSRLMQEIREKRGLTYGIGSHISQTTRGNLWSISGEMNSANAKEALDATNEIIHSMSVSPPTEDELERAKRYYTGQLRSSFDGPFAMASKLRGLLVRGYDYSYLENAISTIWGTSSEELCQLADNYLIPESFYTSQAGQILT